MNCTICNKKVVLVPTAKERAEKYGNSPSYYTKLFPTHSTCFIAKRNKDTIDLIRRKKANTL